MFVPIFCFLFLVDGTSPNARYKAHYCRQTLLSNYTIYIIFYLYEYQQIRSSAVHYDTV